MNSLYEALGGEPAIERIVELHYKKVLADPSMAPFFRHIDMALQKRKFRAYLHTVAGGPLRRSGIELRVAHANAVEHGMDGAHVEAFVRCFREALEESNVRRDLIERLMESVAQARHDVLGE